MTNKLNEVRNKKGMSLSKLSETSGVARSHIQAIESFNSSPTIEVVCKLADALNVKACDIFNCDGYKHPGL